MGHPARQQVVVSGDAVKFVHYAQARGAFVLRHHGWCMAGTACGISPAFDVDTGSIRRPGRLMRFDGDVSARVERAGIEDRGRRSSGRSGVVRVERWRSHDGETVR